MTFKEYLTEMKTITYNNPLSWNPNKTENEWKDRIKTRTGLSEDGFYKLIQKGIDQTPIPIDMAVCLYFIKSSFVLILNTKSRVITTIRDGSWDKPGDNCEHFKIANEGMIKDSELIRLINNHNNVGWLWEINSDFDLIINHECNYCFKVDL